MAETSICAFHGMLRGRVAQEMMMMIAPRRYSRKALNTLFRSRRGFHVQCSQTCTNLGNQISDSTAARILDFRPVSAEMALRRYTRSVDGTIPVQALLYDDEELVAVQDSVGIYDGYASVGFHPIARQITT